MFLKNEFSSSFYKLFVQFIPQYHALNRKVNKKSTQINILLEADRRHSNIVQWTILLTLVLKKCRNVPPSMHKSVCCPARELSMPGRRWHACGGGVMGALLAKVPQPPSVYAVAVGGWPDPLNFPLPRLALSGLLVYRYKTPYTRAATHSPCFPLNGSE